ncbi:MAG: hypothetical protein NC402_05660 [Prevotella sp.]|nr:hypothetical protein [Prevotella sp.]MCM1074572.1 hypothetical protein [Ruminococcus sp.]
MHFSNYFNNNILKASLCTLVFSAGCTPKSDSSSDEDTAADSQSAVGAVEKLIIDSLPDDEQSFHAANDIAMRVRSVAAAINEGEAIDSTDYNFSGVLTDGLGAPLFTDFKGLPGQWEVDVINEREVIIRNTGTGDLMPGSLMQYVASSINSNSEEDETPILQMVDAYDNGDSHIEVYTYGRTSVQVETRPETLPTGEVGPKLEIKLRYDTIPS